MTHHGGDTEALQRERFEGQADGFADRFADTRAVLLGDLMPGQHYFVR